jgi:type VI secretion system protein ImpF
MARTRPKEKLLPSLLDRLTDDDPANRSLAITKEKIRKLEKELIQLKKDSNLKEPDLFRKERDNLLKQLEEHRLEYSRLSESMSSIHEIRQCVKRDLDWLLNSHNYKPQTDLDQYPEVQTSVLNYGLPDLAGMTVSSINWRGLEKVIKQALLNFEPRIIRRSLKVNLLTDESMEEHNTLSFEIVGDLVAEPSPIHLHLRTQLELENGDMRIQEFEKTR